MKKSYLVLIGIMVFIACCLIIKGILFLHPKPGDGGTKIRVLFQNIDKISTGSRVSFAGKAVGEVESIIVIPQALKERPKNGELIYPYELLLSIDSSVRVYESDIITAKTAGLLGERFIEITPQPSGGKQLVIVGPKKHLRAYEPAGMEEAFKDISNLTKKTDIALSNLFAFIDKNKESLDTTIRKVENTVSEVNQFAFQINESKIFQESASTLNEIKHFFVTLNNGNGTLGRMAQDATVYNRLNSSLEKMDYLIESISSFGLLFHTNASWQRLNKIKREREKYSLETALNEIDSLLGTYQEEKEESTMRLVEELKIKIDEIKKNENSNKL